ncbi:MAG TPA: MipA/OmpV family protein [Candidatus Tenderia electrophaga]|uniref:MipA/OmpV family protein n=1 Tax=Candidatus Tenderia electrophaga TaxID=1748243 RepID=A0A832J2Z1_9GAMM|nr:MipA/OmpV family protein [Candidatus Tenderia electrophaga]
MKLAKSCNNVFRLGSLLLLIALTAPAQAQQKPLWELGIGSAVMQLPYYRGSAAERGYLLPYPYLIYRGDFLNIDKNGVRGRLYRSDKLVLNLSLAGGVPVPSDQNGPRQGMPDLSPTIEFGPSLDLRLWNKDQHRGQKLWLRLPLRAAYSVAGRDSAHQGWIFAPYLEFSRESYASQLEYSLSVGPMFADSKYHDYFYGVDPVYATPSRPTYRGRRGYNGSRITLLLQKRINNLSLSAFARLDSLNGTAFNDSPLLQSRRYHIIGFAISWILSQSDKRMSSP